MLQEASDVERRLTELQSQVDRLSLSLHLWSERQEQLPRLLAADSSSTLSGIERTETRLAALETSVHGRLTELSDQIQSMVAEVRAFSRTGLPAPKADAAAWPLDDVVRLHNQLRTGSEGPTLPPAAADASRQLPAAPAELLGRMERLERNLADEHTHVTESALHSRQSSRRWGLALTAVVVILSAIAGSIVNRLQGQLQGAEARAAEAETMAAATARTAAEQIAATRDEVNREIAEANAAALQAQAISDLLVAPDLVRYNIFAADGGAARGQMTFSRTRGSLFTASRLPVLPAGSTYQLWLLTPTAAHSAGVFQPDANGGYTIASAEPPAAPAPIIGASVTVEPEPGSERPTGTVVLARAPASE